MVHPYLPSYGGGKKVLIHILKALLNHGQTVEFLTFEFDPSQYSDAMGDKFPENVVVHALGKKVEAKPPFTVYKNRRNAIELLKKFRETVDYDYTFSTQTISAFEGALLNKAKGNIAYVHFPEIHYTYDNSSVRKKAYLWLYKRWLEKDIRKIDLVFCNSNYTKAVIEKYWGKFGISPIVAYPPVDLDLFWCNTPLKERPKRIIYVGRFIPQKRHEMMKKLAIDLPQFEFISVGGLRESDEKWFEDFSKNLPANYILKPNLPGKDLTQLLRESRIYCHLMEGEHFGIAPIEALASGGITLVHNSGGSGEFIPEEFRWKTYEDLKEKIVQSIDSPIQNDIWEKKREELWNKISILKPENFEETIWSHVETLMQKTEKGI